MDIVLSEIRQTTGPIGAKLKTASLRSHSQADGEGLAGLLGSDMNIARTKVRCKKCSH